MVSHRARGFGMSLVARRYLRYRERVRDRIRKCSKVSWLDLRSARAVLVTVPSILTEPKR